MMNLEELLTKRKYLRGRATRLCIKIQNELPDTNLQQCLMMKNKTLSVQTELNELNDRIFDKYVLLKKSEDEVQTLMDRNDEYNDKFDEILSQIEVVTSHPANHSNHNRSNISTNAEVNHLKLPRVELPTFRNGKGESLDKFLKQFEAIVEKHKVSSYEKFRLLKGQLKQAPETLLESLEVENQHYEKGVELLRKAFGSTVGAKFEVIEQMSNLKLTSRTDPYVFIGEMRTVSSNISSLNITVEDILQFFVWNSMNDRFQNHLTNITNKSRPSFQEIQENIFEATTRYLKNQDKNDSKSFHAENKRTNQDVNTMAINVKTDKTFKCAL